MYMAADKQNHKCEVPVITYTWWSVEKTLVFNWSVGQKSAYLQHLVGMYDGRSHYYLAVSQKHGQLRGQCRLAVLELYKMPSALLVRVYDHWTVGHGGVSMPLMHHQTCAAAPWNPRNIWNLKNAYAYFVGSNAVSPFLDEIQCLLKPPTVFFHSVGNHRWGTSTDSFLAVHQTNFSRLSEHYFFCDNITRKSILGLLNKSPGYVPVVQQLSSCFIRHPYLSVFKVLWKKVVHFTRHVKDISHTKEISMHKGTKYLFALSSSQFDAFHSDPSIRYGNITLGLSICPKITNISWSIKSWKNWHEKRFSTNTKQWYWGCTPSVLPHSQHDFRAVPWCPCLSQSLDQPIALFGVILGAK